MIAAVPGARGHLAPVIAYGIPPLRDGIDTLARRELTDHIAALHAAVHGGPQPCTRCTHLTAGGVHGKRTPHRPGADEAPADPKGHGSTALPLRPHFP